MQEKKNIRQLVSEIKQKYASRSKEDKLKIKKVSIAGVTVLLLIMAALVFFCEEKKPVKEMPRPLIDTKVLPKVEEPVVPKAEHETPVKPEAQIKEEPIKQPEAPKEVIKIEPKNIIVSFTATAENDFTYEVYYTVAREVWFDPEHVVAYDGKSGMHKYSIVIPEESIYRFRLDFGEKPGSVSIKDIRLDGAQQADLSNFENYRMTQIDKSQVNDDGSLTIISLQSDPFMEYLLPLQPE